MLAGKEGEDLRWYVYMLRCGDGSLYTGCTTDVARRLKVHQSGKGAKYTRSHAPVTLAYQEAAEDRSAALRREAAIKKLTRAEKEKLLEETHMHRTDREIRQEAAWSVAEDSLYGVLSMIDEKGQPYGVPVNLVRAGDSFYFHCAREGKKTDCLRKNPQVCVTFVSYAAVDPLALTTRYASAILTGTAEEVQDEAERTAALQALCRRLAPDHPGTEGDFSECRGITDVWKICVKEMTGKENPMR